MVTIEKIQCGVARYLDTELLPKVEGRDRWMLTAAVSLYLAKLPALVQSLKDNPALKPLGLISADGTSIDIDALIASVKPAARQTPAVFRVPFGGSISLTETDLDTIRNYIMQA